MGISGFPCFIQQDERIGTRCDICEERIRNGDKVVEVKGDICHVECFITEHAFEFYEEDK